MSFDMYLRIDNMCATLPSGTVRERDVVLSKSSDIGKAILQALNGCLRRGTVSYIGTLSYDSGALLMLGLSCRY